MPPQILSSHLVTIPVLDALLGSTTSPPNPTKRIQLLSTKLAILTNRPSQPARGQPFDVEIQILRCRLDLASVYLDQPVPRVPASAAAAAAGAGAGGHLKLAENELSLVEKECKGIIKRYSRLVKQERDKIAAVSAAAGAAVEEEEVESNTKTTSTATVTPPASIVAEDISRMTFSDSPLTPGSSTLTDFDSDSPSIPATADMTPTSSTSNSTQCQSTTGAPETKRQKRLAMIIELRIEGLRMSVRVEDHLGRGKSERKARLEGLIHKLEAG